MPLALFEVSGGGGLSPVVADNPFRSMSSKQVSEDAYRFPPKKRRFNVLGSRTQSGAAENSFVQGFVKNACDIVDISKETEMENTLPRKRPRLTTSLKLNLDALTYYPAESVVDEDDVRDFFDDDSSDENYQVWDELNGRRPSSRKQTDHVSRSHPKRRFSYVKSA